LDEIKLKPRPKWKIRLEKFLDNTYVVIFMTVVTVYSLFFDDIRVVGFKAP
jgi:hypothetical protein